MEIKPKPSKVKFSSNRPDVMFVMNRKIHDPDEAAVIESFREYVVSAESRGEMQKKTVYSKIPGETLNLNFIFAANIYPMQGKYEEGLKLFKEKKYKEALPVLSSAAEAGHPEAIFQVAVIYEKGLGMWFADNEKALHWYRKAAALKNPAAALKIADAIYNGDYKASALRMLEFYLLAAESGNPSVNYEVALLYQNGFKEIKPDDAKALQYLQRAAELGLPEAMYDLGVRYEKGQGVPFNSKTSLFWIKKAADKDYEPAVKYWKQLNH